MSARSDIIRAFAVHVLTAGGAAIAFIALIFATGEFWEPMFLCLGLALIVDGLDGPLARKFDVAHRLPRWSGDILDLVVDFTTYVFVPAYAIAASGLIPGQQQRFAGERGLRDAEDRAAQVIADNIRSRLASFFVAGT